MSETLLDYKIYPTPDPIQVSPSTGDPSKASLTLVASSPPHHTITCSSIALSFRIGGNAEDFCSDPTGISSSPQPGWSVKQQGGLFTFTPDTKEKGQVGGHGLLFGLNGIKVNQEPGNFWITLEEEASDPDALPPAPDQTRPASWELTKGPAQFSVGDLNADPLIVESGGSTTLSWSGSGSSGNYTALYEIQYADADGNKVTIDHPKGEPNQPLPPVGGYTVDGLKANPTTFYLLVTVQIQGSNNPLKFARDRTVTVTAPPPPKPTVTSYTGKLQSDGSLLLKWTTQPDHDVTVTLNTTLSSEIFQGNGQFPVQKPTQPLLKNDLYALTAMNKQGEKSDPCVFTTFQKFGVVGPAIGVGGGPWGIAVSHDSSHIFVTDAFDNKVSVIEVNLNNNPPFLVLPTRVDTRLYPAGIAVSPDGKYVFVRNWKDDSVTVFGGTPPFQPFPAPIPAGRDSAFLVVSHDSRYVFVPYNCDTGGGALSVIDTANAPPFQVIQGPTFAPNYIWPMAASPVGPYVFAGSVAEFSGNLWVLQVEVGANPPYQAVSSLDLGFRPAAVAVSPDGHYVFVADMDGHSISVVEVSSGPSLQVLSPPVEAGPYPGRLTASPDGRFLFSIGIDVSVWGIDKNSHPPLQLLQTISIPNPNLMAVAAPDFHFIFVLNINDGTTSVIGPVEVSM
jgi:DNA-binding beta-propeller fold protein YncE